MKNKISAALLSLLLGSIGAHRFYLNQQKKGLICKLPRKSYQLKREKILTLKINWYEEEQLYRTTDFQDFRITESRQDR